MCASASSSRRALLGAAAWSAPVIVVTAAAPAFASSGGSITVVSGDSQGSGDGQVVLALEPDPATVPAAAVSYDDPGASTVDFVRTGTSATAAIFRLRFTTTTVPMPAVIAATIVIAGYGTASVAVAMSPPGALDSTFADPDLDNPGYGVAAQNDGKVLVTGGFTTAGGQPRGGLARFNADGTLDTGFVDAELNGYGYGVAVQADGKVLVTGGFTTAGGQPRGGLARFNADGTLDTGFADPNLNGYGYGVAVQADGKVLVAGTFTTAGAANSPRGRLARFNTDGTLDATFADPGLNSYGTGVAVHADGKVVVAGWFTTAGAAHAARGRLARFNADGTLDTTFGNAKLNDNVQGVTVQADGKVLVTGSFFRAGDTYANMLARFNTDGTLDNGFGGNLGLDGSALAAGSGVAVDDDGKVLVTGIFTYASTDRRHYLARFNADGSLDASFVDPELDRAGYGVAVQADRKVLVTGPFTTVGGQPRGHLARVLG